MPETQAADKVELVQTEAQSGSTNDCLLGTSLEENLTNQDKSCDSVTSSNVMDCDAENSANQKELCDDVTQEDSDSQTADNGDTEIRAESMK